MTTTQSLATQRLRRYGGFHQAVWGVKNVFQSFDYNDKKYEYLDLAPYRGIFGQEANGRFILVRLEYAAAYEYLVKRAALHTIDARMNTVLTGQPGIGKTLFQIYILIRRMQEAKPVAIQIDNNEIVLFNSWGPSVLSTNSSSSSHLTIDVWAICDSLSGIQPCDAFLRSPASIIQTTSPSPKHYKAWQKSVGAMPYIMDVWEEHEVGALMVLLKLPLDRGLTLFQKFGHSVRLIIRILRNVEAEKYYALQVLYAARRFAQDASSELDKMMNLDFDSHVSSHIFFLIPSSERYLPRLIIPTTYLAQSFARAMNSAGATNQKGFFDTMCSYPSIYRAAEWLYGNRAHGRFSNKSDDPIEGYVYGSDVAYPIPYCSHIEPFLEECVHETRYPFYWVSPTNNSYRQGIDAIICKHSDVDGRLLDVWAFQFTIDNFYRSGLEVALAEVAEVFDRKRVRVKWHLVFVGPDLKLAKKVRDHFSQRLVMNALWVKWGISLYACELPLASLPDRVYCRVLKLKEHDGPVQFTIDAAKEFIDSTSFDEDNTVGSGGAID